MVTSADMDTLAFFISGCGFVSDLNTIAITIIFRRGENENSASVGFPARRGCGETLRQWLQPNLIIDEERACSSAAATNDSPAFLHYQEELIHTGRLSPPIGAAVPSDDLTNG